VGMSRVEKSGKSGANGRSDAVVSAPFRALTALTLNGTMTLWKGAPLADADALT
jgi:hypothetical protein